MYSKQSFINKEKPKKRKPFLKASNPEILKKMYKDLWEWKKKIMNLDKLV